MRFLGHHHFWQIDPQTSAGCLNIAFIEFFPNYHDIFKKYNLTSSRVGAGAFLGFFKDTVSKCPISFFQTIQKSNIWPF